MKTLKTIITTTILLFALTSTQHTQAQTKEETIAWIKEKFEKYFDRYGEFSYSNEGAKLSVTPCTIHIEYYNRWHHVDKPNTRAFESFPPPEVLSVGLNDKGNRVIIKLASASGKSYHWFYTDRSDNARSPSTQEIHFINGEANLAERMEKALKHLATFCETKKETF